jgi:hypothetical protein
MIGLGWKLLRGGMLPGTRMPRLLLAGLRGGWASLGRRRSRKKRAAGIPGGASGAGP